MNQTLGGKWISAFAGMTGGADIKVGAPATATGRFEINATLSTGRFAEISFAVKVGNGKYQPAGTDDNAPTASSTTRATSSRV